MSTHQSDLPTTKTKTPNTTALDHEAGAASRAASRRADMYADALQKLERGTDVERSRVVSWARSHIEMLATSSLADQIELLSAQALITERITLHFIERLAAAKSHENAAACGKLALSAQNSFIKIMGAVVMLQDKLRASQRQALGHDSDASDEAGSDCE